MSVAKFDAALNLQLFRQQPGHVDVTVRLHSPLTPDEVTLVRDMGLKNADTRRRVVSGTLTPEALSLIAKMDKVLRLSLVQQMAHKVAG